MSVSAALARTLAAARPDFNARVVAARHARPGFDEKAFAAMLRDGLDPIVAAVETVAPDRVGAVVDAGYDIAILLVGQNLAGPGARQDAVDRLWAEVAPALAHAIAEAPFATLGALSNAALRIAATPGARVDQWLSLLASLGSRVDAAALSAAGQVAAWRAGMAHYRESALAIADTLAPEIALPALGLTGDWPEIRARLHADPWSCGDRTLPDRGIEFGGFTGHGGPFAEPPEPRGCPEGFLIRSGERFSLLIADAWGATLHAAAPEAFAEAEAKGAALIGAEVEAGDRMIATDLPAEGLRAAANGRSLAIASPYSHAMRIYPWRRP